MFQSTHPHGVRRDSGGSITMTPEVSIHAPARGATEVCTIIKQDHRFQSTHPHGVRHTGSASLFTWTGVSIHAPARGATFPPDIDVAELEVSIHAPARGATSGIITTLLPAWRFNPRTRTGCDPIRGTAGGRKQVSIHAPARGATTSCRRCFG